jgi:hypothetical protein
MPPMLDYLSPREYEDLEKAESQGCGWARVVRSFLDGARLRLGWDCARSVDEIARLAGLADPDIGEAIDEAVRWSVGHKLHLLGWQEPDGGWRYFMAVG